VTEEATANPPKVSVVSITYNHEAYIRDSLDGIVAQEIDFPVEVIVADDASTDATPAIIQEYADRYPHLFRPILRSENIGPHANVTDALSAARGEYLALCEGDDYWSDPRKLSKQVTFLDKHPRTAVCFHPVRMIWTGDGGGDTTFAQAFFSKLEQTFFPKFPPFFWAGDLSLEALISRNFIQTNSVVYRRLSRYDDIPANVMPLDWYLHLRHAATGDIAMLAETMAIYRRHPHGMWHDAVANPAKFWLAHSRGHVAVLEATLDLFPDDPVRDEIIAKNANLFLSRIAKNVPDPEGRALLLDIVAQHPRIAMLALRHRRAQTPVVRLKSTWRTVAAATKSLRARATPPDA
jgi:glycosyltransferase involved in cell wall biosynthesis